MWLAYYSPATLEEALELKARFGARGAIIAGGTDVVVELTQGRRPRDQVLIDITRIPGLTRIEMDDQGRIHLGPLVTHNHVVASPLLRARAFPLVKAAWQVGSPQIRNRGTVVGNLVTASPANDTIPPLMALDAHLVLRSVRGSRVVPLREFYRGVRQTVLAPDEVVTEIVFPALPETARGNFLKIGLREGQYIAIVSVAVALWFEGQHIARAAITLGAVAPTIVHAEAAEAYLVGKPLTPEVIEEAARRAVEAARPIDDIRASAAYRRAMVEALTRRALREILEGTETQAVPQRPPLLWGDRQPYDTALAATVVHPPQPIVMRINGETRVFRSGHHKTLLRLLREEAGLPGTKEGCAEGECGACTVLLNGVAVTSCLVPAPAAHGADVVTVEGLSQGGQLHPVQQAFVRTAAVQCGYCTPGFVVAAARLLDEFPNPDPETVAQGLVGNLCRCTGYYSIIEAVTTAHHAADEPTP